MKKFSYCMKNAHGILEIEVSCSEEDYQWLYPLFLRNTKPFKALRDMGFDVVDKHETQNSNGSKSKL